MKRFPLTSALLALVMGGLVTLMAGTQYALLHSTGDTNWQLMPWASWWWAPSWFRSHPTLFQHWALIQAAGLGLSFVASVVVFSKLRSNQPVKDMHGTARWAKPHEIKEMGLLGDEGVFVGGIERRRAVDYLRHDGAEHVLVAAPTRSGKGVSIVVPTLLSWPHSVFTVDMKGELWALTAPWREQYANQQCLRLDIANEDSVRFNPLDTVRVGTPREVGDIQNLVTLIVDPEGKGMDGKDGHWKKAAHALLTGLVCYAIHRGEGNLACVADLVAPSDRDFSDVLEAMVNDGSLPATAGELVASAARTQLARKGEEAASVLSTTANYLTLFRDPVIADNTADSDFDVQELVNGSKGTSLYLVVNPADKSRIQGLTRLILSVILRQLTSDLRFEGGRAQSVHERRLLLLLDEFPALGRLDVITDTLPYMATYGIKAMLVIQDYSQLWATYGKDESLTANCHIRTAFAPNTIETAKRLSEMTGTTTQVKQQRRSNGKMGIHLDDTWSETSRPLMTADEILRLRAPEKNGEVITRAGEMLTFVAGSHPIRGIQPLYFQNPSLQARAQVCQSG